MRASWALLEDLTLLCWGALPYILPSIESNLKKKENWRVGEEKITGILASEAHFCSCVAEGLLDGRDGGSTTHAVDLPFAQDFEWNLDGVHPT